MFHVREYEQKDGPALEDCIVEMQEFERSIEPNRREGKSISGQYLERIIDTCARRNGKMFVAEEAGAVMGYSCVWMEKRPEELISTLTDYAYVSDVIVLPAYREKGVGKALLLAAEEHAVRCGATTIVLGVLAKNAAAIGLYKKVGFREYEMLLKKEI